MRTIEAIQRDIFLKRRNTAVEIDYIQGTNALPIMLRIADYSVEEGNTAVVYARKPSGHEIFNTANLKENIITIQPTTQMMAEVGDTKAQVLLTKEDQIAATFVLIIHVHPNLSSDSAIESADEYNALEELITQAQTAITGVGSAIEEAQGATQTASQAATNAANKAQAANSAADRADEIAEDLEGKRDSGYWDGTDGAAATIQIGTVTTGEPGTQASVTNTGTEHAAVLDFTIPRGSPGEVENLSSQSILFSEASQRQNIQSGETLAILFGKIQKYFSDVEAEVFEKLEQNAESESAQSGTFLLGNLKIQWGRIDNLDVPASGSIQTDAIIFPHAYEAPPFLTCIPLGNYYLAANPTNNVNLSQASFRVRAADGAAHNDRSILWLAIGY